jgi:hypothetical protein
MVKCVSAQSARWSPLEVGLGGTALRRTRGVEPLEGRLLMGRPLPAKMGHANRRTPSGQNGRHEGIASLRQVPDHRDRDWPVADQLTGFTRTGDASQEGVVVDTDQELYRRTSALASSLVRGAGVARPRSLGRLP